MDATQASTHLPLYCKMPRGNEAKSTPESGVQAVFCFGHQHSNFAFYSLDPCTVWSGVKCSSFKENGGIQQYNVTKLQTNRSALDWTARIVHKLTHCMGMSLSEKQQMQICMSAYLLSPRLSKPSCCLGKGNCQYEHRFAGVGLKYCLAIAFWALTVADTCITQVLYGNTTARIYIPKSQYHDPSDSYGCMSPVHDTATIDGLHDTATMDGLDFITKTCQLFWTEEMCFVVTGRARILLCNCHQYSGWLGQCVQYSHFP